MKFIVSSNTLLKKLQILGGVINTSNTIPVLDHFLFDLDGTLVNTDDIYIKVWNNLLKKYNLSVDKIFFNSREGYFLLKLFQVFRWLNSNRKVR